MLILNNTQIEECWEVLIEKLTNTLHKKPKDINAILFLIGVQELGQGTRSFTKEEKQDLMHIAICKILSKDGFYELEGTDQDGWPHWILKQKLPYVNLLEQEKLLKMYILDYFEDEGLFA